MKKLNSREAEFISDIKAIMEKYSLRLITDGESWQIITKTDPPTIILSIEEIARKLIVRKIETIL